MKACSVVCVCLCVCTCVGVVRAYVSACKCVGCGCVCVSVCVTVCVCHHDLRMKPGTYGPLGTAKIWKDTIHLIPPEHSIVTQVLDLHLLYSLT